MAFQNASSLPCNPHTPCAKARSLQQSFTDKNSTVYQLHCQLYHHHHPHLDLVKSINSLKKF